MQGFVQGCARFVELCRKMGLLARASVAIDGSKFKSVNSRDNNFTHGKIQRCQKQIEESVARYMSQLDTADRQTAAGEEPSETVLVTKTRLKEKLAKLEEEVKRLPAIEKALLASPDKQISLTDSDCRSMATSERASGMVAYRTRRSRRRFTASCCPPSPRTSNPSSKGQGPPDRHSPRFSRKLNARRASFGSGKR